MRRPLVIVLLTVVALAASSASANVCATDTAPAASLLFPFVAFDFNNPWTGETTIISVTNLSSQSQVVKIGVGTDLGILILEFNAVLTGYDILRFNMRDVLHLGQLPVTKTENHSEFEGVRDNGPVSSENPVTGWEPLRPDEPEATQALWDDGRCTPQHDHYPGLYVMPIPSGILDLLQQWLTSSQQVGIQLTNDCSPPYDEDFFPVGGTWLEERDTSDVTWMYVTVDVIERCEKVRPIDEAYWTPADEGGFARYDNVLMGDAVWISPTSSTAMQAVHLEADRDLAEIATENPVTGLPISFHARQSNTHAGTPDYREPLPTAWAVRYMGAWSDTIDSSLLVWKGGTNYETPYDLDLFGENPNHPDEITASNCNAYTYYAWDEDANVIASGAQFPSGLCQTLPPSGIQGCPNLFPQVVQEVRVDELDLPGEVGWLLFVWPASNYEGNQNAPTVPDYYQTWMGTRHTAWDTHADYLPAMPVGNFNCDPNDVLPGLGIR